MDSTNRAHMHDSALAHNPGKYFWLVVVNSWESKDLCVRNDRGKIALEYMTIPNSNGSQQQAILLSRTDSAIRVAILGSDEVAEFRALGERWNAEHREPVQIEFSPVSLSADRIPNVDECLCSTELAAHLLKKLFSGDGESKIGESMPPAQYESPSALPLM